MELILFCANMMLLGFNLALLRSVFKDKKQSIDYKKQSIDYMDIAKKRYEDANEWLKAAERNLVRVKTFTEKEDSSLQEKRDTVFAEVEQATRYKNLTFLSWERIKEKADELEVDISDILNKHYPIH